MDITINQQDLLKLVNISQKAVSPRSTMQILSGLLIEAKDGYLIFSSTDFDISIETKLQTNVKEDGAIVIGSNLFGNIVRKLPNTEVHLKTSGSNLEIKADHIEYSLTGMDVNEFPTLPKVEEDNFISLSSDRFIRAINHTLFSTSVDDTRPVLMGVLMEIKDSFINFVSLDGYRLSRIKFPYNGDCVDKSSIIPANSLSELIKVLPEDDVIEISEVPGHMLFEFGQTKFYTRLLEGNFIDYESILASDYSSSANMDRRSILDALDRISIIATDGKAKLVKLSFTEKKLEMRSNTEIGEGYELLPIEKDGEDLNIAFNNSYLSEGIRTIDSKDIKINFKGPVDPITVKPIYNDDQEDMEYTYLVLPVKLKSEEF